MINSENSSIHKECFPFGEPLRQVEQGDRSRKRVLVLGVYSSAVHARWVDRQGKVIVRALAVASEPCIFWDGLGAAEIISSVKIPREAGTLEAPEQQFNGPSGRALDEGILKPLGLIRNEAWLSDLVPHSCLNPRQAKVIREKYDPMAKRFGLTRATIEPVHKVLASDVRRDEIFNELTASGANVLITLGDQPLKWFVSLLTNVTYRLAGFSKSVDKYGRLHPVEIRGQRFDLLPIAHPRQIRRLGSSDSEWARIHASWVEHVAPSLLQKS